MRENAHHTTPSTRAALCALLGAITLASSAALASEPAASHPLVGRWKVATINGAPPPRFLSGTVLVIQADAQIINIDLKDSGSGASQSAVPKLLRESLTRGTWRADKTRVYMSNSPRRESGSVYSVTQNGKLLGLDPDPYFSNADIPSKATYERLP